MQKQIDEINERLGKGDEKFNEVIALLSKLTTHLQRQDEQMAQMDAKIDKGARGTESIIEMWNGGVTTVRFFCRMAEAWRFFIKSFFVPVVIPGALLCAFIYYRSNGVWPEWAKFLIKLIM